MKPTIRKGEPQDFRIILPMLVKMHGDVGEFPISIEKVSERIDDTLATGLVLIAEIDNQAEGSIGLVGEEPWYSETKVIGDTWIWPGTGRHALSIFRALVAAAHEYALRNDFPCILTLYSLKSTARKSKLFERYGRRIMEGYQFKPAGGDYLGKEAGNGML